MHNLVLAGRDLEQPQLRVVRAHAEHVRRRMEAHQFDVVARVKRPDLFRRQTVGVVGPATDLPVHITCAQVLAVETPADLMDAVVEGRILVQKFTGVQTPDEATVVFAAGTDAILRSRIDGHGENGIARLVKPDGQSSVVLFFHRLAEVEIVQLILRLLVARRFEIDNLEGITGVDVHLVVVVVVVILLPIVLNAVFR